MAQLHETVILHDAVPVGFEVHVASRDATGDQTYEAYEALLNDLVKDGFLHFDESGPRMVIAGLIAITAANEQTGLDALSAFLDRDRGVSQENEWLMEFAEYVASADLIPVQNSPITTTSVFNLVQAGGGFVIALAAGHPVLAIATGAVVVIIRPVWSGVAPEVTRFSGDVTRHWLNKLRQRYGIPEGGTPASTETAEPATQT